MKSESKGLLIIDDSMSLYGTKEISLQPTIKPYKNRHLITQGKAK